MALFVFGAWVTHIGGHGLAAYRPVRVGLSGPGGVPRWARFLIWLALIVAWSVASLWLLRQPQASESDTK